VFDFILLIYIYIYIYNNSIQHNGNVSHKIQLNFGVINTQSLVLVRSVHTA